MKLFSFFLSLQLYVNEDYTDDCTFGALIGSKVLIVLPTIPFAPLVQMSTHLKRQTTAWYYKKTSLQPPEVFRAIL